MPLLYVGWPGKEWIFLAMKDVPQDIQDWYKGKYQVNFIKQRGDEILIEFEVKDSSNLQLERFFKVDDHWTHFGPRNRK